MESTRASTRWPSAIHVSALMWVFKANPPGEAESFSTNASSARTILSSLLPERVVLSCIPVGFSSLLSSSLPSFGCLCWVSCPLPSSFVNTVLGRRARGFNLATFVRPRRRPFLAMLTVSAVDGPGSNFLKAEPSVYHDDWILCFYSDVFILTDTTLSVMCLASGLVWEHLWAARSLTLNMFQLPVARCNWTFFVIFLGL